MRRLLAAAVAAAGILAGLSACGSSGPAWCGQQITASKAGSTPLNMGPYGWHSLGYLHVSVPADFPALLRRDAAQYNRSHNLLVAMVIGEEWKLDYQRDCKGGSQ